MDESDKFLEHIKATAPEENQRLFLSCFTKAQERFITRKVETYLEDKFTEDPDSLKTILPSYIIDHFKQKAQNDVKANSFHLTLCPPDDDIDDLFDTVKLLLEKRMWITNFKYAFEQRSETEEEMGRGLHCHMYFEADKPQSHVLREIKSIIPKMVIKLQKITRGTEHQVINYILGQKEDQKTRKTEIDKIWREAEGILPYYDIRNPYDASE